MPPNPGAADTSATYLDPSDQNTCNEVHVEPVSFDPGSTIGTGAGSRASALFEDHLLLAGLKCAVPAGHGHRLIHQLLTGLKQSRRIMGVSARHHLFFRWRFCLVFVFSFVSFCFLLFQIKHLTCQSSSSFAGLCSNKTIIIYVLERFSWFKQKTRYFSFCLVTLSQLPKLELWVTWSFTSKKEKCSFTISDIVSFVLRHHQTGFRS